MKDKYNWEQYELTENGQFACRYCKGTKKLGLPIGSDKLVICWMCEGSGYMIDVIKKDYDIECIQHSATRLELKELKEWIKSTSKCSICHGDSNKTIGGSSCKECGRIGSRPWGG
jgi:hypothetical protein